MSEVVELENVYNNKKIKMHILLNMFLIEYNIIIISKEYLIYDYNLIQDDNIKQQVVPKDI